MDGSYEQKDTLSRVAPSPSLRDRRRFGHLLSQGRCEKIGTASLLASHRPSKSLPHQARREPHFPNLPPVLKFFFTPSGRREGVERFVGRGERIRTGDKLFLVSHPSGADSPICLIPRLTPWWLKLGHSGGSHLRWLDSALLACGFDAGPDCRRE